MKKINTALLLLFYITVTAQQTPNQTLNLSFDKTDSAGRIIGCSYPWATNGYYTYKDDSVKIDGPNSIRLQKETAEPDGKFSSVTFSLPANFSGKKITLKGFIKTENVNGYASLWLRADVGSSVADFGNLGDSAPTGNTDWKNYTVSVKMDKYVTKIVFGGLLSGSGKAWFDKFELYADDKPIDKVEWQVSNNEAALAKSNVQLDSMLTNKQKENLFVLAKVWGFLKYHHPEVAKGKNNFDEELFKIMQSIANAASIGKRSELLLNWINSLGNETDYKLAEKIPVKNVHLSPNLNWINEKAVFSNEVINKLNSIYLHRNSVKNAYIKLMPNVGNPNFDGEEKYAGMTANDDGLRMLALFRYWNVIEYYFPSKYLIKEKWDDILKEFIPQFAANKTSIEYKLTCLKLINQIHDTHANIYGDKEVDAYFGDKYPIVRAIVIDGKTIVTRFTNDSLSKLETVTPGDEIISVNNKMVAEIRAEREPYLCASNSSVANRNFTNNHLLRSSRDSLAVVIKRDGQLISTFIKLYPPAVSYNTKDYYTKLKMYKFLNDDIGYITLAVIKADSLKTIFKTFANTRGIVIDIRNYPSEFMPFAMGNYLKPSASPFVKFTSGNISHPGFFTFTDALSNGSKNADHYKGKIVILVNETSQSQAEYTTMALRTAPNAIVMGSQTAGADGNVSTVPFPGGFGSYISGIGVFYPDGKETQGIGIVPDIEVKPTREGIKKGVDELLEKAMQYISAGK